MNCVACVSSHFWPFTKTNLVLVNFEEEKNLDFTERALSMNELSLKLGGGGLLPPGKDDEGMSAASSSTQQRSRRREVRKVEPKVILTRFLSPDTDFVRAIF